MNVTTCVCVPPWASGTVEDDLAFYHGNRLVIALTGFRLKLFNQKTNMLTMDRYNLEETSDSTGIDLSGTNLTKGLDWRSLVASAGGLDPRYGSAAVFNPGFQGRLLVKFIF